MKKEPIVVTRLSYGKTVNTGNYESIRFDFTARVNEGEDWVEVLDELKSLALKEEKKIKKQGY